jgi:hypothetical protein
MGYTLEKVGIPREVLLGNPPLPVDIPEDLSLEELKERLSDLVRRDLGEGNLGSSNTNQG